MSLDKRIETKGKPCLGCHSDLDKYKKEVQQTCPYKEKYTERGCEGCQRRLDDAV